MIRTNRQTALAQKPMRLVLTVSAAIGLSIMGDSLMYGILPLEAENLGIPLAAVGLLLSANRLIRLVSNTPTSAIFERLGPRAPFIGATVLGFVAALLYGTGWGFMVFLLARMGWGVAWSGLRQGGYVAVWQGDQRNKGRLMGILWGIVRLGSAISVVSGGYLRDHFGYRLSVGVIAALTALAIPVALAVPWPQLGPKPQTSPPNRPKAVPQNAIFSVEGWRRAFQVPARRWLLTSGFTHALLEGVIVATVSLFLAERLDEGGRFSLSCIGVGTTAGILLAVRWTANLLFGPLIGFLSDRLGQSRMIVLLAGLTFAGLIGAVRLSGGWLILCLLPVFIALAGLFVTLTASSSGLAAQARRPHLFVGVYTTATDAGAAVGPLLAFNLGQVVGFDALYVGISMALLLAVLWYWRVEQGAVKVEA